MVGAKNSTCRVKHLTVELDLGCSEWRRK